MNENLKTVLLAALAAISYLILTLISKENSNTALEILSYAGPLYIAFRAFDFAAARSGIKGYNFVLRVFIGSWLGIMIFGVAAVVIGLTLGTNYTTDELFDPRISREISVIALMLTAPSLVSFLLGSIEYRWNSKKEPHPN